MELQLPTIVLLLCPPAEEVAAKAELEGERESQADSLGMD